MKSFSNQFVDVSAMESEPTSDEVKQTLERMLEPAEPAFSLPPMNDRDANHFRRDFYNSLRTGRGEGIALERSQAYRAKAPNGFGGTGTLTSVWDMCRALVSNVHSAGGALIGTDVQPVVEPALRAASVVIAAGARVFTGLRSSSVWARATSGVNWSWLPAIGTITPTDPVLAQVAASPHRCAGATTISTQLDIQSNGIARQYVFEDLIAGYAAAQDLAFLRGSGAMGEPAGITANGSTLTKTFGGAATAAILLDMISQVAGNNANDANISWALHPDVREKWATAARATNTSSFLYEVDGDTVLGKKARITTNASSTGAICGDFSAGALLHWGPDGGLVEFTTDPYTRSLEDEVRIVAETLSDVIIIRPANFIYATDTVVA